MYHYYPRYPSYVQPSYSPLAQRLEIHTEDRLVYQFYPIQSNVLNFKIKAPHDAHIALTSAPYESRPIYEIFFGGWKNTKSVIRKDQTQPDIVEVQTPNILDPYNFKGFWIRWDYGTISAGVEGDYTPILRYQDPALFQIQYFGICTGWGAKGHWILETFSSPQGGYVPPPAGGYVPPPGGYMPPGAPGIPPYGQPGAAASLSYPSYPGNPTQGYVPGVAPSAPTAPIGFNTPMNAPRWVQSRGGSVPPNAVVGGSDCSGEPMYVARAHHEGALLPGKLVPSHGVAYVAWGGRENPKQDYEILCDCSARWVPSGDGQCPPNAVVAGQTESGESLYVGRAFQDGSTTVGKVQPSHGVCYIPFGGNEVAHKQYEVLIL